MMMMGSSDMDWGLPPLPPSGYGSGHMDILEHRSFTKLSPFRQGKSIMCSPGEKKTNLKVEKHEEGALKYNYDGGLGHTCAFFLFLEWATRKRGIH